MASGIDLYIFILKTRTARQKVNLSLKIKTHAYIIQYVCLSKERPYKEESRDGYQE